MNPKEVTDILAAWFEVPAPTVCISDRRVNGVYWPLRKVIQVSTRAWRGLENSVIHEFAHHLQRTRHGVRVRAHGPEFKKALLEVATAWFGDPEKYKWGTEYLAIRAWHGKGCPK